MIHDLIKDNFQCTNTVNHSNSNINFSNKQLFNENSNKPITNILPVTKHAFSQSYSNHSCQVIPSNNSSFINNRISYVKKLPIKKRISFSLKENSIQEIERQNKELEIIEKPKKS